VTKIDILQFVDRLEELVERGWRLPLSGKVIIDEDTFLNIADQMRVAVPQEIKLAREIRKERDKYVKRAVDEANRIVAEATETATRHLESHELRRRAEADAENVVNAARQEAARIRAGAEQYAEEKLSELGEQLSRMQEIVSKGVETLRRRRAENLARLPARERVTPDADQAPQEASSGAEIGRSDYA